MNGGAASCEMCYRRSSTALHRPYLVFSLLGEKKINSVKRVTKDEQERQVSKRTVAGLHCLSTVL